MRDIQPKPGEVIVGGVIKKIIFRNNETGYTILSVLPTKGKPITIKGETPSSEGDYIEAVGRMVVDPKHGDQMSAREIHAPSVDETNEEGLIKYLGGQGRFPHVGEEIARKIVQKYGMDAIKKLDENINLLSEFPGITPTRLEGIKAVWDQEKKNREINLFMSTNRISQSVMSRTSYHIAAQEYASRMKCEVEDLNPKDVVITEEHTDKAYAIIRKKPYKLVEVDGIGFKIADAIAKSMGIVKGSRDQISAALIYAITEAEGRGSTRISEGDLIASVKNMTDFFDDSAILEYANQMTVSRASVANSKRSETDGSIVSARDSDDNVFFAKTMTDYLESYCAKEISLRVKEGNKKRWKDKEDWNNHLVQIEDVIKSAQTQTGISLAEKQIDAVVTMMTEDFFIINGGPGTGKTTLTRTGIRALESEGKRVMILAPTGKAAQRASEATGKMAQTIHRALIDVDSKESFDTDVLLIDESSMLDVAMLSRILSHTKGVSVGLIGDADQLPSIGAGNVMKDILDSKVVPKVTLDVVFRQADSSPIIHNAHLVNHGKMPSNTEGNNDFFVNYYKKDDLNPVDERILDSIVAFVKKTGKEANQFMLLSPMRRGLLGVDHMNKIMQMTFNPKDSNTRETEVMGRKFRLNDRVIHTKNQYALGFVNGQIGTIKKMDFTGTYLNRLTVEYDDGQILDFAGENAKTALEFARLGYAITMHKSQGSEAPIVIVVMSDSHYVMQDRQLLYTAITRAKDRCVLLGTNSAIHRAVTNKKSEERKTGLREYLVKWSTSDRRDTPELDHSFVDEMDS